MGGFSGDPESMTIKLSGYRNLERRTGNVLCYSEGSADD